MLGISSVSFCIIQFVLSMQSAQYATQDRIPTADVNNSRKFVTPQGDLLTDHLFTEFRDVRGGPGLLYTNNGKGYKKISVLLQDRTETGFDFG